MSDYDNGYKRVQQLYDNREQDFGEEPDGEPPAVYEKLNRNCGDICWKCKSKNTLRVGQWVSTMSNLAFSIEIKCLDCGYERSW